jgi:hypothetical protein
MQVAITIKAVENKFPGGTLAGNWHLELALSSDPSTITDSYEGASPSHTFDLPEGAAYNARGMRLAADGTTPLGPVVSTQFAVGEDLVAIDVASSISAGVLPLRR